MAINRKPSIRLSPTSGPRFRYALPALPASGSMHAEGSSVSAPDIGTDDATPPHTPVCTSAGQQAAPEDDDDEQQASDDTVTVAESTKLDFPLPPLPEAVRPATRRGPQRRRSSTYLAYETANTAQNYQSRPINIYEL